MTDATRETYQRRAASVTDVPVAPPAAKEDGRRWSLRRRPGVAGTDPRAWAEAEEVLVAYDACVAALADSLAALSNLKHPRLLGKVEDDQRLVDKARGRLDEARRALTSDDDFGGCGKGVEEAHRLLSGLGGPLLVAVNRELGQVAVAAGTRSQLERNHELRKRAQDTVGAARAVSPRAGVLAWTSLYALMADWLALAAEALRAASTQRPPPTRPATDDGDVAVVHPEELETFADVGGLEEVVDGVRRSLSAILEGAGGGGRLVHNGILLHGPPGTGKTLLARAAAGEYGLRFIRLSPALIASSYQHEPAQKLSRLFARAASSAPCLLFLDEVETIGGRREAASSPDQRELVVQLLNSLEEYRATPGLVLMAATNALDQLDPALREGRFDTRIAVPLPDRAAREDILAVLVESCGAEVEWSSLDLAAVAREAEGYSGAGLATVVAGARERARSRLGALTQADFAAELEARGGQDRPHTLEERVGWDDVVLPEEARRRLQEILAVFARPELGRRLGVRAPAGILLHGPPGTGKTTVARALASEARASFYEQSAADLLSKWVGESEQRVAQLFARARSNRPSIIFCDEIDAVLRRRSATSVAPWEERVVAQFLRELDGLHSGEGVLLVGATNRPDILDDAVRGRRLVPIEVALPDVGGRRRLLEVLWRDVTLGPDVDLDEIARATEGFSGADLRGLRDAAGMKALARAARDGDEAAVTRPDVAAALAELGRSLPKRRATGQGHRAAGVPPGRGAPPATPR